MKKGFTLAEVLLVLAIIGVMTALCMGAGRVNLQKAYNLYYFRSFEALNIVHSSMMYYEKHFTKIKDAAGNEIGRQGVKDICTTFKNHWNSVVSSSEGETEIKGCSLYKTRNQTSNIVDFALITVEIPTINRNRVPYYVLFSTGYNLTGTSDPTTGAITSGYEATGKTPGIYLLGHYLPTDDTDDTGDTEGKSDVNQLWKDDDKLPEILDDASIIPVFIDNGVCGRHIEGAEYEPIVVQTYREGFCRSKDKDSNESLFQGEDYSNIINCDTVSDFNGYKGKPIKLLKPGAIRR